MEGKVLSLSQCKEYLKNIRDLELSCYSQAKLVDKIECKIKKLLKSVPNDKIIKPQSNPIWMDILFSAMFTGIGALIGGLIGIIFSAMAKGALLGGGVVCGFCVLSFIFAPLMNKQDNAKYEHEMAIRKLQISDAKKKLSVLDEILMKARNELEETKKLLNRYYGMNFIYPKYRGIVPICQIYEYLESGRCFSLLGPGGAYNLYESEVRSNLIISKLDDVISRLEDLSTGQQKLASLIRESNIKIDRLSQTIDCIEENTAMSTYYNKITATNTNYLSWLASLETSFR